jgi:hypothetical protein
MRPPAPNVLTLLFILSWYFVLPCWLRRSGIYYLHCELQSSCDFLCSTTLRQLLGDYFFPTAFLLHPRLQTQVWQKKKNAQLHFKLPHSLHGLSDQANRVP